MKSIIIFSDLHCVFNPTFDYWKPFLSDLVHTYPDSLIVCLGDMDSSSDQVYLEYGNRVLFVRGNNDHNQISSFQEIDLERFGIRFLQRNQANTLCEWCLFQIEEVTFLALHGHCIEGKRCTHPRTKEGLKPYKKELNAFRKRKQADYLLYGHTHIPEFNRWSHLINPGSANELLCLDKPTYMEIQVCHSKIKVITHEIKK